MTCLEALELLHARADGDPDAAFDGARAAALDAHVASCADCARAARQIRALRTALRSIPAVRAPDGFRERVMQSLPGGGRLLAFPRFLVPLAAAAALVAGFVVVQRAREVGDVATAGAKQSLRGAADVPVAESDLRSGISGRDTLDAARKNAAGPAADPAAAAPPAELAAQESSGPATPGFETSAGAAASGAAAPPADPEPGGFAKEPSPPTVPGRPPKAGAPRSNEEDKAAGSKRDFAEDVAAPAAVRVVIFRSEADALAFVASLGADAAKSSEAKSRRADEPPSATGAPGGGGGDSVGGSEPKGGGGGAGGGIAGGKAPAKPGAPKPAASVPTADGAAKSMRLRAPIRLVRRVAVTSDAWRTEAGTRNGSIIDTPELVTRADADPTPESLAGAVDAWRRSALRRSSEKGKSAKDAPGSTDGDEGTALKKETGERGADAEDGPRHKRQGGAGTPDAGGGAAPRPVPAPALDEKLRSESAAAGETVLLIVVDETPAPPAAPTAVPPR